MIKMHLVTAYHGLKPKDEPSREPAAMRRRMLLLGVPAAALLAGCASKPTSNGSHASADPTRRRPAGSADGGVVPINLGLSGELRDTLYARVMMVVNTPYTYGGNTPEGGFDCSGLIQYAMAGITTRKLPRTTSQWAGVSAPIERSDLQRGDFVFFNTLGGRYSHMGIYAGNNQFVHAPSSGGVVRTVSLANPYFAKRFTEARTVFSV
ncbi:cell wall-associated NlpC family hydrolase [Comamonas odontotermitis]|uniref:Cell wall-associated NlpC family hydrolase n=2 Tax=Comamonas odontotermitis TaxID=379895 RepID=A0ABR6RD71_9BURK|nr:C40 family peptidase [Comamonas odontotermitis]MBB6577097.1 cell wall-associated NlpC family hydrolase [Comamonas odontotermitis]